MRRRKVDIGGGKTLYSQTICDSKESMALKLKVDGVWLATQ
jgi:hypothetical protein